MVAFDIFLTVLADLATRDFARSRALPVLSAAGVGAPGFALAAALFDFTENVIWLLVLGGHAGHAGPPIATTCAALKFLFIGLAIIYALAGLCAWLLSGRKSVLRRR
jgi:hypothetical protein